MTEASQNGNSKIPPESRWLSVPHAAAYMDMGESTVWALLKLYKDTDGREGLPSYHPTPGSTRIKVDDIDRFFEQAPAKGPVVDAESKWRQLLGNE